MSPKLTFKNRTIKLIDLITFILNIGSITFIMHAMP